VPKYIPEEDSSRLPTCNRGTEPAFLKGGEDEYLASREDRGLLFERVGTLSLNRYPQ